MEFASASLPGIELVSSLAANASVLTAVVDVLQTRPIESIEAFTDYFHQEVDRSDSHCCLTLSLRYCGLRPYFYDELNMKILTLQLKRAGSSDRTMP